MKRTFVISDTHFWHSNVIQYENRPFQSAEEMNAEMIKRWNNVVSKGDEVIHLGDVCFSNKENAQAIISKLNGRKRLIMGNHDRRRSPTWWKAVGFDDVSPEPILFRGQFILSHEPIYDYMPFINVHGHIHGQVLNVTQYVNVCVEHWDYKPINFDVIEKMFQ